MASSLLFGRLDRVGVGGTGTFAACELERAVLMLIPGRGGNGIAGGGDGKDATDADLRRFDVVESERLGPLGSSCASSYFA